MPELNPSAEVETKLSGEEEGIGFNHLLLKFAPALAGLVFASVMAGVSTAYISELVFAYDDGKPWFEDFAIIYIKPLTEPAAIPVFVFFCLLNALTARAFLHGHAIVHERPYMPPHIAALMIWSIVAAAFPTVGAMILIEDFGIHHDITFSVYLSSCCLAPIHPSTLCVGFRYPNAGITLILILASISLALRQLGLTACNHPVLHRMHREI